VNKGAYQPQHPPQHQPQWQATQGAAGSARGAAGGASRGKVRDLSGAGGYALPPQATAGAGQSTDSAVGSASGGPAAVAFELDAAGEVQVAAPMTPADLAADSRRTTTSKPTSVASQAQPPPPADARADSSNRREYLAARGWQLVELDYARWRRLSTAERYQYLRDLTFGLAERAAAVKAEKQARAGSEREAARLRPQASEGGSDVTGGQQRGSAAGARRRAGAHR
jgi:hypothetical protein